MKKYKIIYTKVFKPLVISLVIFGSVSIIFLVLSLLGNYNAIFGFVLGVFQILVLISMVFNPYEVADEEKIVQIKIIKLKKEIFWIDVKEVVYEERLQRQGGAPIRKRFYKYLKILTNDKSMDIRYDKKAEEIIRKFYKGKIKGLDDVPE